MPVYDPRLTSMEDIPNTICIVLQPTANEHQGEHQIGTLNIDMKGVVGYLPIYSTYIDAIAEYPNASVYVMSLNHFKSEKPI